VGTDDAAGCVYFMASPSRGTERYLYRSKLDGSGQPERVTPSDQPGTHTYDLAPGAGMAFHTWSQFDAPPVTDVVSLPAHKSLRALTDPSKLKAKLPEIVTSPVEFLTVDVSAGVTLGGWMLKPPSFAPSAK